MAMNASVFTAKVMHKRTLPRVNQFTYGVYYLAFPIDETESLSDGWRFGVNSPGLLSFYNRDHGNRTNESLRPWAEAILAEHGLKEAGHCIVLVTMPRVLGYAFNPVSFWLCFDDQNRLRAVICEVNNTFGESHSYLCAHDDHRPIDADDWLEAGKLFHVSPFLHREGHYRFRFSHSQEKLGIWIDYYNAEGTQQLLTSLMGKLHSYSRTTRQRAFWKHPLVTFKTIYLIHWQAVRLCLKKIRYVPKPHQIVERYSSSGNLTKK